MWSHHLFFYTKNKKKLNKNLHDWIVPFSLIEKKKKKYIFGKLSITWLWVIVTNYQRYTTFFPSYNLSKIKAKIKPRSTYPKTLNSEARLQNGKVLGTHSAQTKSGLLDSSDLCTPFMHAMNDMLHKWNKLNHTNLFMNVSSSLF